MNTNRPDQRIVESITRSQNLESWKVRSGAIMSTIDSFIPAFTAAILGGLCGWFLGIAADKGDSWQFAGAAFLAWLSYMLVYRFDRKLSAPEYSARYWDIEPEQDTPPVMMQTANNNINRLLTDDMRRLLVKFGKYYPRLQGFGIGKWEPRPARIQRDDLKKLYDYLRIIGAMEGTGQDRRLTEWGEGQLTEWANNRFEAIFEMVETPLPQNTDTIRP